MAENNSGATVGKNSIGSRTSRARTRKIRLENSVPTLAKPIAANNATSKISARKIDRLNMNVKTTNTINIAIVRNTKLPSDLPINTRSRDTGANINAPTASFSSSWEVARVIPTTPANVIAAQSTPGPVSNAVRALGSMAIANMAITNEANITIATATSRLRDSMRSSLSVSAQIIESDAVNRTSTGFEVFQSAGSHRVRSIRRTSGEVGTVGRHQHRSPSGPPLFDDLQHDL